jgi:hypothetical protein
MVQVNAKIGKNLMLEPSIEKIQHYNENLCSLFSLFRAFLDPSRMDRKLKERFTKGSLMVLVFKGSILG